MNNILEVEDSIYLYSEDQKTLYSQVLEELESRTCPHSHTVYALMDVEESEVPEHMVSHVSSCKECQQIVNLGQAIKTQINQLIPSFKSHSFEYFDREINSMFMRSEFSLLSRSKSNMINIANGIVENFLDILSVIFSVKMGLTYIVAGVLGLFLNWIL